MPPNIYNLFLAPNFMVITPKLRSFAPNYLIKMPLNKYLRFPIHKFAKTEKSTPKKIRPYNKDLRFPQAKDCHPKNKTYPLSEFNEFEPRLKSAKNQFQLSAGLNLEKLNTILSGTNHI